MAIKYTPENICFIDAILNQKTNFLIVKKVKTIPDNERSVTQVFIVVRTL